MKEKLENTIEFDAIVLLLLRYWFAFINKPRVPTVHNRHVLTCCKRVK